MKGCLGLLVFRNLLEPMVASFTMDFTIPMLSLSLGLTLLGLYMLKYGLPLLVLLSLSYDFLDFMMLG